MAKADTNQDAKITFEEVLEFSDFNFIESSIPVALGMGHIPAAASYLTGGSYSRVEGMSRKEAMDNALVVWLTTLNSLMDRSVFRDEPSVQCGLDGES